MKKNIQRFRFAFTGSTIVIALCFIAASGCKNDITPSLYDKAVTAAPSPQITSVSPSSGTLAGVSVFTITGKNFSATKEYNTVYFDAVPGTIISNTATQIVVKAAPLVKDSIRLRVQVTGALSFSNTIFVSLAAAVTEFGSLDKTEEPFGMACDTAGNLYCSIIKNFNGDGIRKFDLAGTSSQFITANSVTYWSALKMGPGGLVYAVRNVRAMYTIAQGGVPTLWAAQTGATFYDLDFDKLGNVWTGGNGTLIYKIKVSDKTVKSFPFVGNIRSVRVYNDYVYVAAKVDSSEGIYRFKIVSADSIGTAEKYFELTGKPGYLYNGYSALAITFNTDGDMYVGTNSPDAMLVVHPDKSYETFYTGLLSPESMTFAWGKGSTLYVSRGGTTATHVIVKINTLKTSAPYYGRGDL